MYITVTHSKGRLLTLLAKNRKLERDKRASLICPTVSYEGKKFYNFDMRDPENTDLHLEMDLVTF